jgi:hypothetical protein
MPGFMPGIHVLCPRKGVDGRDKPGHDDPYAIAPPVGAELESRQHGPDQAGQDARHRRSHVDRSLADLRKSGKGAVRRSQREQRLRLAVANLLLVRLGDGERAQRVAERPMMPL